MNAGAKAPRPPRSAITRINDGIKAIGRQERLVKGRGYYYLHGGDAASWHHSAIYQNIILPEHYAITLHSVNRLYADAYQFTDTPAPVVPFVHDRPKVQAEILDSLARLASSPGGSARKYHPIGYYCNKRRERALFALRDAGLVEILKVYAGKKMAMVRRVK